MKKRLFLSVISATCIIIFAIFAFMTTLLVSSANEILACDGAHTGYTALSNEDAASAPQKQVTLSEGKYYLSNNVGSDILITGDVTLCLNGKTLRGKGSEFNRSVITVKTEGNGGLHLCDCKGSGKVTGGKVANDVGGGGISVMGNSELTVSGGNITGNSANRGGGIAIIGDKTAAPKTVKINNTNIFSNNSATYGGGIYAEYTNVTIDGSKIYTNNALSDGGGLYLYSKEGKASTMYSTTLNNAEILSNTAINANGGGVALVEGNMSMTGGKISNNKASVGGGAMVVHGKSVVTQNSGTLSGNAAGYYGGAVQLWGGEYQLKGGTISGNTSKHYGGGFSLYYENSQLKMSGGEITGNNAASGGGVYLYKAQTNLTMTGGKITANKATSDGGGIYSDQGEMMLSGGNITGNSAAFAGGGICAYGNVNMSGNIEVLENTVGSTSKVNNNIYLAASKLTGQAVNMTAKFSGKIGVNVQKNYNGAVVTKGYTSTNSDGQVSYDVSAVVLKLVNGELKVVNDTVLVTFIDCDLSPLSVKTGELLNKPTDPTKTGYTFVGWTLNNVAFDFATTKVNEDITLKATWELTNYTITYHVNGGVGIDSATFTFLSDAITLPLATRDGYTFKGWYKSQDFTGSAVTEIAKGTTENMSIYAKWEALEGEQPPAPAPPKKGCKGQIEVLGVVAMIGILMAAAVATRKKKAK